MNTDDLLASIDEVLEDVRSHGVGAPSDTSATPGEGSRNARFAVDANGSTSDAHDMTAAAAQDVTDGSGRTRRISMNGPVPPGTVIDLDELTESTPSSRPGPPESTTPSPGPSSAAGSQDPAGQDTPTPEPAGENEANQRGSRGSRGSRGRRRKRTDKPTANQPTATAGTDREPNAEDRRIAAEKVADRIEEVADRIQDLVDRMPPGRTRDTAERGAEWAAEQAPGLPGRVKTAVVERWNERWSMLGPVARWTIYNGSAAAAGHAVPWLTGGAYPSLPGLVTTALVDCIGRYSLMGGVMLGAAMTTATWLVVDGKIRGWCATKSEEAKTSSTRVKRVTNFWFIPAWIFRIPLASVAAGTAAALGIATIAFFTGASQ